jgi:hypothetical protein
MEWMRDPDRTGHLPGAGCSPFVSRTCASGAPPTDGIRIAWVARR